MLIPVFWDVDLTITKRYQQVPIFAKHAPKIAKACAEAGIEYTREEDYFKRADQLEGDPGLGYMQRMIWDARPGGCLDGLNNKELYEAGKTIEPAQGFAAALKELEHRFKGRAIIHHFFVSVGIREMILGMIHANHLQPYVAGVAASEFFEEDGRISGIKRAVSPFTKNEWIIGFMKGDQRLLNMQLRTSEYKYSYRNMIVIGDGYTDTSKFAYAKKRGGTPCAVYEPKSQKSFDKTNKTVGVWVDYVIPRDYTPGTISFNLLSKIIEEKLVRKCPFRPVNLHDYKKGAVKDAHERQLIKHHILDCPECEHYFSHYVVDPSGRLIETCNMSAPDEDVDLTLAQFIAADVDGLRK